MNNRLNILGLSLVLGIAGCNSYDDTVFQRMYADDTGIHFNNEIVEDEVHNVFNYMNIYTGAGVAAGDINNDGLIDLYFAGNIINGQLYLNQGDFKFDEITLESGIKNNRWETGVNMVDINQDGWTDIYICVSGSAEGKARNNMLYINNGDNTFTESAEKYGIAENRQTMHSTFFDYDMDGDLDLFLIVNAAAYEHNVNVIKPRQLNGEAHNTDILYRNNGDNTFTDVSKQAGILVEGYSLGLAVSDINQDNLPDIYISNDFIGNDIFYLNNGDGTFSNQAEALLKHTSYAGMGNDLADFNNDGLVDIMVLDMRPEDNKRQKLITSSTSYDRFQLMLDAGYGPQYSRNTLQLNQGNGLFSEISFLAGVSSTDWSWSALFADFDNDADKDLFVTNGFMRDLGDLDYIHYQRFNSGPMGTTEAKIAKKLKAIKALKGAAIQDYVYENTGKLKFVNRASEWGVDHAGYSNGAVYADFDNDGDLDLVINNINEKAHIYKNTSTDRKERNFIKIKLIGSETNRQGIGAKVFVKHNGANQFSENFLNRGYESSVSPILHFGLGKDTIIQEIQIVWPDGRYEIKRNVSVNSQMEFNYKNSNVTKDIPLKEKKKWLTDQTADHNLTFEHEENKFVDFKRQPILPHMHSRGGPGIAVGDIDSNGLDDIFIGAAAGKTGAIFLHQADGSFLPKKLETDSSNEDMGTLLFDADGDGDLDLYVVSGGTFAEKHALNYQDRLYLNNGQGQFTLSDALPEINSSGSVVVAADYDQDGDLDLFVGGRVIPGEYPLSAQSYLLKNNTKEGRCTFENVATEKNNLSFPGLVTSALWSDFDNDGWIDLILAGEFMPIMFYKNKNGELNDISDKVGLSNINGWWNSILGGDFDNDGDIDYIAGNLGLNSRFVANEKEPLCIYAKDYDKNGRLDPVMCYYTQGENYLGHTRDDLIDQINAVRSRFMTYKEYAEATFATSFMPSELEDAFLVKCHRFESSYVENLGNGKFNISALPRELQLAPIYGMIAEDFNKDGKLDLLLAGNAYANEVNTGRYDAGIGKMLLGNGDGSFDILGPQESGFVADGDVKALSKLKLSNNESLYLISQNSGPLKAYSQRSDSVVNSYTAEFFDAFADIKFKNGKVRRHEFNYGASYLSQSSRYLTIPMDADQITITDFKGNTKKIKMNWVSKNLLNDGLKNE